MTGFLIDTNVLSELRKGARADRGVTDWVLACNGDDMHVSVLTAGELQNGIERLRRRDAKAEYDKFKALEASAPRAVDADFEQATKDLKKLPKPKKPKPPKK